jgi:peptidoglycan/xylan/chitin deacetylase (PgdA/CDA1 family)
MYHYIRINPVATDTIGFGLSVTPADFSQQMAYLANHGYQSLTVSEVAILVHDHHPLPAHPIVITFDDGYDDLYTNAYPILKQYGLHGEAYIISGKVSSPGYATWSMLRDMIASGVMTVGSHTVDHPHLTTLTSEAVMAELTNSKQQLESELGVKVDDFCYPFGDVNTQVAAEVARAGYRTGTTTAMGWWQPGDNLTTLPRLRVAGGESLASFIARLP